MSERKRINFIVSEEKKLKWDDYVAKNPEYDTMADFIRTSVAHEMADNTDSGETNDLAIKIADISEGISDLTSRLESMDHRLRNLENQSIQNREVNRITGEVYAALPTYRPGTREWEEEMKNRHHQLQAAEAGHEPDEKDAHEAVEAWKGTAEGLASALDEPPHIIREALDKLHKDSHNVRKTEDGEYYRYE